MNNTVITVASAVVIAMITAITVLLALDKDPSTLVAFMVGSIIPSAVSYLSLRKAGQAKDAAETTVQQTNGRMTEIIENNRILAEQVASLNGGYTPPVMEAKPEYITDAEGNPILRRTS